MDEQARIDEAFQRAADAVHNAKYRQRRGQWHVAAEHWDEAAEIYDYVGAPTLAGDARAHAAVARSYRRPTHPTNISGLVD